MKQVDRADKKEDMCGKNCHGEGVTDLFMAVGDSSPARDAAMSLTITTASSSNTTITSVSDA